MRLHALCYYRSKSDEWTDSWRDIDYTARNLVKAVKRKPFRGFSTVRTIAGRVFRIEDTVSGQQTAINYASEKLAKSIAAAGYEEVAVIPIPSSSHVNPKAEFTGSRLADWIEKRNSKFVAKPVLFLRKPLPTSSGGGGRDSGLIESYLLATNDVHTVQRAVLLDDVYTTGAHVRAATRFLARYGIEIEDVFVVGRTCWEKPENMFKCAPEEIYCEGSNFSLFG